MVAVLLLLLLLALLGGFGFAVHALWIVALIVLAVVVVGYLVRGGRRDL